VRLILRTGDSVSENPCAHDCNTGWLRTERFPTTFAGAIDIVRDFTRVDTTVPQIPYHHATNQPTVPIGIALDAIMGFWGWQWQWQLQVAFAIITTSSVVLSTTATQLYHSPPDSDHQRLSPHRPVVESVVPWVEDGAARSHSTSRSMPMPSPLHPAAIAAGKQVFAHYMLCFAAFGGHGNTTGYKVRRPRPCQSHCESHAISRMWCHMMQHSFDNGCTATFHVVP
jgi:hypothetical protein